MFRMVGVEECERKFQTIVWRLKPSDVIRKYLLNTLTYGLTCSQYLAIRTLLQMALDHEHEYPVAAAIVREEMYSDNVLTGAHTIAEAQEKVRELISLFQRAQMNLRKWSANEAQALSFLPGNMLVEDRITLFNSGSSIPLLGIAWHTSGDYFCFHLENIVVESPVTKRKILSRIARIFDPLGWIGPVTIVAKILMQSLWLQKLDWDQEVPKEVKENWCRWVEELPLISNFRIPRWTGFSPGAQVELHGFGDASKVAYGAVLYLRFMQGDSVFTSLQVAKSKVAPIKTLSIPRLELCASLLLTRLAKQFLDTTKLEISSVHLWTDSADVLFWLRDHPSRWNVFIAERCSQIHTSLPSAFWHHVKSKDNPADAVSRGLDPSKLQDNELWWKGPAFLTKETEAWSKAQDELNFSAVNVTSLASYQVVRCASELSTEEPSLQWWPLVKYSKLGKLLRITALSLRFIGKTSSKLDSRRQASVLNLSFVRESSKFGGEVVGYDEQENAKFFCCYLVQRVHLNSEYCILQAGKSLSGKNSLASLNPVLENHLIKVGGRLANSLAKIQAKHPIILPRESTLATLFIRQAHLDALHGCTQLTLATLRQQVWILQGRTRVRQEISRCVPCVRYAAKTPAQLMGDLPEARVRPSSPFEKAGVDYAGPISVRLTKSRGKGTLKGYVCVFVCMATKAVHLELVEDYTSESFIAAFQRFTARRGHCKELFSDQGTNFVGADALLDDLLQRSPQGQTDLSKQLSTLGTTWHFNPPSAPHFGGLWEAAVKSLKHHLRRVIGAQVLTFSELSTLLCQIEACLNSRPLVALSDDPSDLGILTPAHFLIQRSSYLVPEPDYGAVALPAGKRWQLVSQMVQHFWVRWQEEYLSALQKRNKWLQPKPSPRVGDLVLLRNELAPPSLWSLGRISALHPGKDNRVRVVSVKTSTSCLKRPIVKLVFLPVEH